MLWSVGPSPILHLPTQQSNLRPSLHCSYHSNATLFSPLHIASPFFPSCYPTSLHPFSHPAIPHHCTLLPMLLSHIASPSFPCCYPTSLLPHRPYPPGPNQYGRATVFIRDPKTYRHGCWVNREAPHVVQC